MRYALLLYLDPTRAAATTAAEAEGELSAYAEITQDLATAGVLRGGEAFMPAQTAKVVRVSGGSVVTVPAPPTGLELSGFYIVDCEEQQALEIAASVPVATHGAVEVRPLMELPELPQPQRLDGGYLFVLVYGSGSDWVRNVLAAGRATLTLDGQDIELADPRLVDEQEARRLLPGTAKPPPRLLRISEYLRMDLATS